MKNLLFAFLISMISFSANGQESLIASIMQVDPVNLTIGEEDQKKVDEYDAQYAEELTKLDEMLLKQSEDYAAEITKLVEGFADIMTKGEERQIKNEKQKVNTMANSKTFALTKLKKQTIQGFHNRMSSAMRSLPRPIQMTKDKELDKLAEEYREKNHEEFQANQRVLKAFKATEHVTKTHVSEMPSDSSTEN